MDILVVMAKGLGDTIVGWGKGLGRRRVSGAGRSHTARLRRGHVRLGRLMGLPDPFLG